MMKAWILVVSACAWSGTALAQSPAGTASSQVGEKPSAPVVQTASLPQAKAGEKAPGKGKAPAVDPAKRAQAWRNLCERLGVGRGCAIADVGCGKGQDTMTFAQIVGATGKVYAEEIGQEMLNAVAQKAKEQGCNHVVTVLGGTEDPNLPDATLDLISMHLVFHHFAKPQSMLANFWKDLKPGGHLVIIDRERGPQREWPEMETREKKHFWTGETTVVRLARESGFLFETALDGVWPETQAFVLVFRKPDGKGSPSGDPDLPLPLEGVDAVSQLPQVPDHPPQILFVGIDRGRAILPLLRKRFGPGSRLLDVVLEEWKTSKGDLPSGASADSGDIVHTAKGDLPSLTPGSLDAVVFADGFSRVWDPVPLLRRFHSALRPKGWVAILDRKAGLDEPRSLANHRRQIAPGRVRADLGAAGFQFVNELNPPAADRFFLLFQN